MSPRAPRSKMSGWASPIGGQAARFLVGHASSLRQPYRVSPVTGYPISLAMLLSYAKDMVTPAQLATDIRDAITRLNRRLRQVRPVGELTQSQLSALTSLELAGALTPRELAEAERVQPPTMTRIVGKLETLGLVQRDPHPTDGRQVILSATPAGREVFAEHRRARDEWLTRQLTDLPPTERATLHAAAEILSRIARGKENAEGAKSAARGAPGGENQK